MVTKKELGRKLFQAGMVASIKAGVEMVETLSLIIADELVTGNDVKIDGVATLKPHKTASKDRYNISTKQVEFIEGKATIKAVVSSQLKAKLNA